MDVVQPLDGASEFDTPGDRARPRPVPARSRTNWGWLPGLPLPASLGRGAWRLARSATAVTSGWRWLPASFAAGVLPVLAFWPLATAGCQTACALLLTIVCLGCIAEKRFVAGVAAMSMAFFAHSVLAGGISAYDPATGAALFPGGQEYWEKQLVWIQTGRDPEYVVSYWLGAHLQLVTAVLVYTYTSLGALTFVEGFYEVDLMNFYNAQLLMQSKSGTTSLSLGWHMWSFARGLGYLLLTYEMIALSLERLTNQTLSGRGERIFRWSIGLGFVLLDGVLKYFFMETVRSGLFENLGG